MKRNHLMLFLTILMILPNVCSAELYKWKDKNGQMQYTDTPPPANIKPEDIIGKKSPGTTGKAPLSTVTSTQPVPAKSPVKEAQQPVSAEDAAAKIRQRDAEVDKKIKQEREAQAKIKAENCVSARANYESYAQGGRIYKMNEQGEREYLGDVELKAGEIKAREEVNKYCS